MKLKEMNTIISESPIIIGFSDVNEVAEYVSNSSHSILLNGYLLYAYLGSESPKSVIITTGDSYGKFILSEIYDCYKMIYPGFRYDNIMNYAESFSGNKKLSNLYSSIIERFFNEE